MLGGNSGAVVEFEEGGVGGAGGTAFEVLLAGGEFADEGLGAVVFGEAGRGEEEVVGRGLEAGLSESEGEGCAAGGADDAEREFFEITRAPEAEGGEGAIVGGNNGFDALAAVAGDAFGRGGGSGTGYDVGEEAFGGDGVCEPHAERA